VSTRHRQAHPDHDDHRTALGPEAVDRIWAEVQRRIDLGADGRPALRAPAPSRALPLALVAAALVVLLVGGAVLGDRGTGAPLAAASSSSVAAAPLVTFDELAATALAQPGQTLDPATDRLHLVLDAVPQPGQEDLPGTTSELWIAPDGTARARSGPLRGHLGETFDWVSEIAGLTPAQLEQLPADPPTLLLVLEDALNDRDVWRPAERIGMLLAVPALADLGARVTAAVAGPTGQPAVVVEHSNDNGDRTALVLDVATTRTLSIRNDGGRVNQREPALTTYRVADISPPG
jgi:hypothetical protein